MDGAAQAPAPVPEVKERQLRLTDPQVYEIGYKRDGKEVVFVQDGLSFYEKNDFMEIVSQALLDSMERGLSVIDIAREIGVASSGGLDREALSGLIRGGADEDVDDEVQQRMSRVLDTGLRAILKFLTTAPRLLEDVHLLALGVDPEEWSRVRPFLRKQPDEIGFKITEVFIAQNVTTFRDFLARWSGVGEAIGAAISPSESVEPSAN